MRGRRRGRAGLEARTALTGGRAGAERRPGQGEAAWRGAAWCSRMTWAVRGAGGRLSTTRPVAAQRGQVRRSVFERRGNPVITANRIEGELREIARPQCPTELAAAVRCSPCLKEFPRVIESLDRNFGVRGGPFRTVAPGVTGSIPVGRPTNPAPCSDGAPARASIVERYSASGLTQTVSCRHLPATDGLLLACLQFFDRKEADIAYVLLAC